MRWVLRVLWVVCGLVLMAVGLSLLSLGISVAHTFGSTGTVTSPMARVESSGAALVSDGLSVTGGSSLQDQFGNLTLGAASASDQPVFLGMAREDDIFNYLSGVPYDVMTNVTATSATLRPVPGSAPAPPPQSQTFWVRSAEGPVASFDWPPDAQQQGYRVVVMNADGTTGVTAQLQVGFVSQSLPTISQASAIVGALLLVPAVCLLYLGFRRFRKVPGGSSEH